MVEAIQKDERRLPVTAAKVAALMFVVAAFIELLSVAMAGFWGDWSDTPSWIALWLAILTLAWGLSRLKRWAWVASVIVSGLAGITILLIFSGIVYVAATTPNALQLIVRRGNVPEIIELSQMLAGGVAMLIAFFALLSKSARREFGIGRFAALKKGI